MPKVLRDANILFRHSLLEIIRNPVWVIFGLFQPIVYLALFTPFLSSLTVLPGFPTENAVQFFVPSVLIMMAMFNTAFVGFTFIDKLRSGVIERLRVTPVSRMALVVGFVLRDAVVLVVQSLILLAGAFLFGFRIAVPGLVLLFVLLLLVGVTMAALSYALALILKEEGALASTTNFFMLPLFLLAGVLLPLEFAPTWVQRIAAVNPFSYATGAAQALANGRIGSPSVIAAFAVFAVLSALSLRFVIRTLREAVA